MTRAYPKNAFVSEVLRTNWTEANGNSKNKTGGLSAIVRIPDELNEEKWGEVQVFQPDNEEEHPGWYDLVTKELEIRLCVRGEAKRENELLGKALPLKNQPTLTQRIIKAKLGVKEDAEKEPIAAVEVTEGDKLEEQLKEEVEKKQHLETLKLYLPRLRYLIKKGEWLANNETGLLLAQSAICRAVCEWEEDHSSDADSMFTQSVIDACRYLVDAMVPLRGPLFDDEEPKGTLSVTCRHGQAKTVLDLKHLQ